MGCLQSTYCNKCGVPQEYYEFHQDGYDSKSCREHNWAVSYGYQEEEGSNHLQETICHDCIDAKGNCYHRWEDKWC